MPVNYAALDLHRAFGREHSHFHRHSTRSSSWSLPPGDDADDFEAVARGKLARGEFGGRNGLTVVFDDDAAGKQVLGEKEIMQSAWEASCNGFAVGGDGFDHVRAASQSFHTGS